MFLQPKVHSVPQRLRGSKKSSVSLRAFVPSWFNNNTIPAFVVQKNQICFPKSIIKLLRLGVFVVGVVAHKKVEINGAA